MRVKWSSKKEARIKRLSPVGGGFLWLGEVNLGWRRSRLRLLRSFFKTDGVCEACWDRLGAGGPSIKKLIQNWWGWKSLSGGSIPSSDPFFQNWRCMWSLLGQVRSMGSINLEAYSKLMGVKKLIGWEYPVLGHVFSKLTGWERLVKPEHPVFGHALFKSDGVWEKYCCWSGIEVPSI